MDAFLASLGDEIVDPEEDVYLAFTQPIPSQNLGFVNATATTISLTVGKREIDIQQSPTLLSSNRSGGTTGAVVWKVTPLFAQWLAWENNCLFKSGLIGGSNVALELGCGISGLVAMTAGPKVSRFIATDQEYVFKLLKKNLEENVISRKAAKMPGRLKKQESRKPRELYDNIQVLALDWETSSISNLPDMICCNDRNQSIDLLIACDCIYNENLHPFVSTCVDICRSNPSISNPTICVIAQQLRSDTIFQAWLSAFHAHFRVWRVPDSLLVEGLQATSGFIVHFAILRPAKSSLQGISD